MDMDKISIQELHEDTERWVRMAANNQQIVVTDGAQPIATLVPFYPASSGKPLPDREDEIRKMSRIEVDSAVYISEMRDRA
jgi:antitoxin (DNA-binding transcriptional repressor) of toxin-antitoxin stability system